MEYNIEELLILVKELTDSYTSKESTSITYEAAQQLMGAVMYCIQENYRAFDCQENSEALVSMEKRFQTAREAYDNGYRCVVDKIRKANELYNNIILDFKDYGNHAYYDTVVKGIPEFFKWYDPVLNPMKHIILIDYNVLEPLHDLEGIDLIYRYLLCIQMEQKFLRYFPDEYIRKVLVLYHSDYEELIFNLCGVLLKKFLVNRLIDTRLEDMDYNTDNFHKLSEIICQLSKEELEERLYSYLQAFINDKYSGDQNLYRYLANEISNISEELRNTVKNHCYGNLL
ncbi:hypothetical protein H0486_06325 [Lachnospiraceae bacterium MD1]|uniref:Uncharacterized protein n=1 Tax=Variimorphobacter saccharofermentans TaxID=2755051 RepID=A0A839JYL8_9FIRM|nr:DUF6179 domain-containing protein [Variimorphobacter saccharofermentans]MBB2182486.1 hypothetical protein [Variimorphobacter saccharofermentans]